MKFPKNQDKNHQTPPQNLHDDQSIEQQLMRCQLTEQDFQKAIKIISKVKLIQKQKLTPLKKKHPTLHHLFKNMSQFFIHKQQKSLQKKKLKKQKRIQMRKKATMRNQNKDHSHPENSPLFSNPHIIDDEEQPIDHANSHQGQILPSICYVCKHQYKQIDSFYHQHCSTCAQFGKMKRNQSADLRGLTALVTGARIKIGFEIALKLLRDGAIVYTTTRFTRDALLRYQKQKDYQIWKQRLFLIQCDFLAAPQVTMLINYLRKNVKKLDILINNAAQTLARPKTFFTFQLQNQKKQIILPPQVIQIPNCSFPSIQGQSKLSIQNGQSKCIDLTRTDQFGQPLDLRQKNTWKENIQDVSLFDCLSTQIINSTIPFHLIGQLKSLMVGQTPSWVINVSSMQGVFYRQWKSSFHPQTNMAKASLNMITRTCAQQFARNNIYMNSVDTGWVTDQNPYPFCVRMSEKHDFHPPLDCLEGAMRVIDPIYQGVNHKLFPFGKFLKDYKQSHF